MSVSLALSRASREDRARARVRIAALSDVHGAHAKLITPHHAKRSLTLVKVALYTAGLIVVSMAWALPWPEQVGQRTLQPPAGQGLKGLEVSRDGMQPRPERCAPRRLWPWSQNARPAGRTVDRKASMMRDEGLHRR